MQTESQQEIYLNFENEFKIFYKFKHRWLVTPDLPIKELLDVNIRISVHFRVSY